MLRDLRAGSTATLVVVIIIAAAVLRALAAWMTIDTPGDGVSRALEAYAWSRKPNLIGPAVWLPGFTYLAGMVCLLIPDPLVGPRLLNVLLGSASVPLLYALARPIFGGAAALAAAAILAVLPMHVGLSASSLTEAGFVFAMLGGVWSAFGAADRDAPRSRLHLALLAVFGIYVEMLRYETWLLLPMVVAYVGWHRRSLRAVFGLGIAFLCFPVLWSIANYVQNGDALYGFTMAATDVDLVDPVAPLAAIAIVWWRWCEILGPVAAAILVFSIVDAAVGAARGAASPERVLLLALTAASVAIVVSLTLRVGSNLFGRYLILATVLALPFATAWTLEHVSRWQMRAAVALVCLLSFGLAYAHSRPTVFVTRDRPLAILGLNEWLRHSPYRDDPLVFTRLGWHCSYAPLYWPALLKRMLTVSNYTTDQRIGDFIRSRRPSLLVTQPADGKMRERVERELGAPLAADRRVKTFDQLEVYDIRGPR